MSNTPSRELPITLRIALAAGLLALASPPAGALVLQQDGEDWCVGEAVCVDSPQAGGEGASEAARLATELDTVDLFSGELRVRAVDLRIPGPHGLDLVVQRTYSSKIVDELGQVAEPDWAGLGWQVLPGGRIRFEPSSSSHVWIELPGRGRQRAAALVYGDALYRSHTAARAWPGQASSSAWVTHDFTFVYDAGGGQYRAITTEGVVYEFDFDGGPAWDAWTYGERVFNVHGDEIELSYDTGGAPGALTGMSDAAGRSVSFTLDGAGYLESMSWTDSSGGTATIDYSVAVASDGSYQRRLTTVDLPTGESFAYDYAWAPSVDERGELDRIELPTGATIEYAYGTVEYLHDVEPETGLTSSFETRVVAERVASPDGGSTEYTWTYGFESYDDDHEQDLRTTTVELPDGTWIEQDYIAFSFAFISGDPGDTGSTVEIEAVDRAQVGAPVHTRVYAHSAATTPTKGTWTQYQQLDADWNLLSIASTSDNPFAAWTDDTKLLLPFNRLEYRDGTFSTSDEEPWVAVSIFGNADEDFDVYGNNTQSCVGGLQPSLSEDYGTSGPMSLRSHAWSGSSVLEGWNLVRLVSEATSLSHSGFDDEECPSPGPDILSETTTTWGTSGVALGRPTRILREARGAINYSSPVMPSTNPSEDEDYVITYPSSSSSSLELRIAVGGSTSPARTRVLEFQWGALANDGWRDGSTTVWEHERTVDDATGLVLAVADANGDLGTPGQHDRLEYDALGFLIELEPALGETTTFARTFVADNLIWTATRGDEVLTRTYDGLGRLIEQKSPNGLDVEDDPAFAHVDQQYDGLGRSVTRSTAHDGTPTGWVEWTWDELSRPLIQTEHLDGTTSLETSWEYWRLDEVRTDGRGIDHDLRRNFAGGIEMNTPATGEGLGAQLAGNQGWNSYHQQWVAPVGASTDLSGRCYLGTSCYPHWQYQFLDANDEPWLLVDYQAFAKPASSWTSTFSGQRVFQRDAGRLPSCEAWDDEPGVTGEELRWRSVVRDFAGRVIEESHGGAEDWTEACPGSASPLVEWAWDEPPSGSSWTADNALGRPVQVEDEAGRREWSYDLAGRVENARWRWTGWPARTVGLDYGYDEHGRLASLALTWPSPAGARTEEIVWSHDHGRESAIDLVLNRGAGAERTVAVVEALRWLPTGIPDELEYGNGVSTAWSVDGLGRIDAVATTGASLSSTPVDLDEEYEYDENHNLMVRRVDGSDEDLFSYDEVDRLTQVSFADTSTIDFTWNDFGNLVERQASDSGLSHLNYDLSSSSWAYNRRYDWAYNGAGQVKTAGSALSLTWHANGKPSTLEGTDWTEITYDHAGRPATVQRCLGGSACSGTQQWTLLLHDDQGRLLARFGSSGPGESATISLQELYIYLGAQLVAVAEFSSGAPGGSVRWVHTDVQGSVRLVSDESAQVRNQVEWTPFGAIRSLSGDPMQRGLAYAWQPAPYAGHPVVDVGARARHAELGWFLSPDPVEWGGRGDPQSYHRSQYARGNPMTMVDPSGEAAVAAWVAAEAAMSWLDAASLVHTAWQVSQGEATWGELGTEAALTGAGMVSVGGGAAAAVKWGRGASEVVPWVDPNRLSHIFGKAEHALDEFVAASGGRERAFARIQEAANAALKEGRLIVGDKGVLPGGDLGNIIDVGGTQVRLIGGRVVDGEVVISFASRKGLP